jgi:hypothetical protein
MEKRKSQSLVARSWAAFFLAVATSIAIRRLHADLALPYGPSTKRCGSLTLAALAIEL